MNYIIVIDSDRPSPHPFLAENLFTTLADAETYVATYLSERAHRIVPIPSH